MKKILVGILLIIIIIILSPKINFLNNSTVEHFSLTEDEYTNLRNQSKDNNLTAMKRLYQYYYYSLNDDNKYIKILEKCAELGDTESKDILDKWVRK